MSGAMTDPDDQQAGKPDIADFGYRSVRRAERQRLVDRVFHSVARRYDLMNDLMSGGIHRLWKDILIDRLSPRPRMALLDVAGGTGDIAFRAVRRARDLSVTVCDYNPSMLEVGRSRALDRGMAGSIDWVCGDAQALPFPDNSVDAYTIAFGLRNVTDRAVALREARRVLRPGGRFLCLEFSQVALPVLGEIYDRYSFRVLPWLGQIVARDRAAYEYLVESIRRFPPQAELAALIGEAGLEQVRWQNLSGGVCAIHSAWRL